MHSWLGMSYNVVKDYNKGWVWKSLKKVIAIILAGIAAGCLIAAGVLIAEEVRQNKESEEIWEELRPSSVIEGTEASKSPGSVDEHEKEASTESAQTQPGSTDSTSDTSQAANENQASDSSSEQGSGAFESEPAIDVNLVPNPYADSFIKNEDMAGWLSVPGTNIDYPIMWTPRDENYYLYRDFNGKDNKDGCLILDTDSSLDPLTTNLIIHGHNMKSGAMFGNLTDYANKTYCENHKQVILHTESGKHTYEVIAVFRSQVYKKTDQVFKFYKFFQADTEAEFNDFYDNIKKLSLYDTGVTAQFGDNFITLSTCVYHVTNGRFVVVAKEVENENCYLPLE